MHDVGELISYDVDTKRQSTTRHTPLVAKREEEFAYAESERLRGHERRAAQGCVGRRVLTLRKRRDIHEAQCYIDAERLRLMRWLKLVLRKSMSAPVHVANTTVCTYSYHVCRQRSVEVGGERVVARPVLRG